MFKKEIVAKGGFFMSIHTYTERSGALKTGNGEGLTVSFQAKDGSSVIVRPARPEDAEQIVKEVKYIVEEGGTIKKERVRSLEEERNFIEENIRKGNMYIVAEVDGKVKGLSRVLLGELQMIRHVGEFRVWLSTDTQGKGIGRKILEYTLQWGRSHPELRKIMLGVYENNEGAHHLYQSVGFVEEGRLREQVCFEGQYYDEIVMAYFVDTK
jgi:RimJ/RimL family protein N-acetyltransferase